MVHTDGKNPMNLNAEARGLRGLSSADAAAKLHKDGYNEISETKQHPFLKFLGYFWGPIPGMIEAALILSALNREWADFFIVLFLLLFNAFIVFSQEYRAENAIAALKSRLAIIARTYRDWQWIMIPARELVVGDAIRLKQGDIVPADSTLTGAGFVMVDESALTGESMPVEKKAGDFVYSGSIVKRGEMNAYVKGCGVNTYFSRTAKLAEEEKEASHLQKTLIQIGKYLINVALILATLIFIASHLRQEEARVTLQYILILVVAAIPAALPAILSITMAVGAQNLAKKEAIVRKITAIEEMAGMDILCIDKTGTITENNIKLGEISLIGGFSDKDVLFYSAMCSRLEDFDPIDTAILNRIESDKSISDEVMKAEVIDFVAYDSSTKYIMATVRLPDKSVISVVKGAPQVIMDLVSDRKIASKINKIVSEFASNGQRALGVAVKRDKSWEYAGVLALYDAPRVDSAQTLQAAKAMGIEIKMITGDHNSVSRDVARRVNLGENIISVAKISNKSDNDIYKMLVESDGVSEVLPENKYGIVKIFQEKDHIVGMTGDGVNDAPALKKANCGIAVYDSTDAAKSAADMVLTKAGTSVIIDAVQESRYIFERMNNYAIYRIAETIRLMAFTAASIIMLGFYPVSAIMIVFLVILNDIPIITIAYDNVLPSAKPVRWNLKKVLGMATTLGLVGVVSSFIVLYFCSQYLNLDIEIIRTIIFLKLAIAGHLLLFTSRTKGHFWTITPNKYLVIATLGTQVIATFIAVYGIFIQPIGWTAALAVWGYCLALFLITDPIKVAAYKWHYKD